MRRFGLVGCVLVLALACNDQSGDVPSVTAASDATSTPAADHSAVMMDVAERMSSLRSLTMELRQQIELKDGPELLTRGSGEVDFAGRRGSFTLDLPDVPGASGTPDVMDIRWDGTTMYLRGMPGAPPRQPWVHIELNETQGVAGFERMRDMLDQGSAELGLLYGARNVTVVGDDELEGVATTRFAMTVDFAKAVREVPPDRREALERYLAKFDAETLEIDAWVDEKTRLRRLEFTIDGSDMAGSAGSDLGRILSVVDYADFNRPVDPTYPAAAKVTPFADYVANGG